MTNLLLIVIAFLLYLIAEGVGLCWKQLERINQYIDFLEQRERKAAK